jgi:hypothetical protein
MTGKTRERTAFEHARRRAFWNRLLALVRQRANRLLSWEDVCRELCMKDLDYQGLQSVPLTKIVGSVGRYQDFDRAFMPTKESLAPRWQSIARAYFRDGALPPVKLYKIGDAYFVVDGNHRVSVARDRGIESIDALVTEVQSRVPVTDHVDADELEIKGEYARFLEQTDLDSLRPGQQIEFTIGGGYERLSEQLAYHRHALSLQQNRPVSREEAARDWYDHLYLPLVQVIREQKILADFPGRTEADLYLWIMDHQAYLQELCGPEVEMERAAADFAERHAQGLAKRVIGALKAFLSGPACEGVAPDTAGPDDAGQSGTGMGDQA